MAINKVFEKRRYQERGLLAFKEWSTIPVQDTKINNRLASIILATGLGKTKVATDCITWLYNNNPRTKILWGAHREELIEQASETIKNALPQANVQIELAQQKARADSEIVVGSVQSLVRERKNLVGFVPDYIYIDEWHHYSENNVQYHNLLERFPNAKIIGLTATPYRFSGGDLPLGHKLIEVDIGTAIRHGYLVPLIAETIKTNISLAGVKKRAGDFAIDQLSAAVNVDERNILIAKRIIKAIKEEGRHGILFGVDVAHAKAMYQLLKNEVRAAEIYGETDKDVRREIMVRARNKEIDVIVNNLVLTEGLDLPHISFVAMAKPTSSMGQYLQCCGRGARLSEGKTDCLIIDVFDKVKITQSRITYSDMAKAGDIDGSNKRTDAILKEPIAESLKNFPIMMRLEEQQRLTVDNETWFAPSWTIAENQWVISWQKTEERILLDKQYELKPLAYAPNMWNLRKNHMQVYHRFFGAGDAYDIDQSGKMMINFEDIGVKAIDWAEVSKREPKYEKKKLEYPIRRLFYICMKKNGGRLISLLQDGKSYKKIEDIRGDKTTIDEFISATAATDDMMQIVKTDAKWREKSASDAQLKFVKTLIKKNNWSDDIDFNEFSAGDASVIIDQISWHKAINDLFGAEEQKHLIGYNSLQDDV